MANKYLEKLAGVIIPLDLATSAIGVPIGILNSDENNKLRGALIGAMTGAGAGRLVVRLTKANPQWFKEGSKYKNLFLA